MARRHRLPRCSPFRAKMDHAISDFVVICSARMSDIAAERAGAGGAVIDSKLERSMPDQLDGVPVDIAPTFVTAAQLTVER